FRAKMDQAALDIPVAAQAVAGARDDIVADAQKRLGRTFSVGDYPLDLSELYGIEVSFPNLRPSGDLPPEIYEAQHQYLTAKIEEAAQLAQQSFTAQFAAMLAHLAERLKAGPDGKPRGFRDSVVGNLKEFFNSFAKLKLVDGDDLDGLIHQAKELVGGVSAQDLRDSPLLKQEVAQGLAKIEEQLAPLIVTAPRRRIIKPTK